MIVAPRRIWKASRLTSADAPARIASDEPLSLQIARAKRTKATVITSAMTRCANWIADPEVPLRGKEAALGRRPGEGRDREPGEAVAHDGGDRPAARRGGRSRATPILRTPGPTGMGLVIHPLRAGDRDRDQRAGERLREAGVEHREELPEARVQRRDLDVVQEDPQAADDAPGRRRGPPRSTRASAARPCDSVLQIQTASAIVSIVISPALRRCECSANIERSVSHPVGFSEPFESGQSGKAIPAPIVVVNAPSATRTKTHAAASGREHRERRLVAGRSREGGGRCHGGGNAGGRGPSCPPQTL